MTLLSYVHPLVPEASKTRLRRHDHTHTRSARHDSGLLQSDSLCPYSKPCSYYLESASYRLAPFTPPLVPGFPRLNLFGGQLYWYYSILISNEGPKVCKRYTQRRSGLSRHRRVRKTRSTNNWSILASILVVDVHPLEAVLLTSGMILSDYIDKIRDVFVRTALAN